MVCRQKASRRLQPNWRAMPSDRSRSLSALSASIWQLVASPAPRCCMAFWMWPKAALFRSKPAPSSSPMSRRSSSAWSKSSSAAEWLPSWISTLPMLESTFACHLRSPEARKPRSAASYISSARP
jgi:hypothetical protein